MKALSIIVVLIIIPTFLFAQKPKQKSLICTFILTPIATLVGGNQQLISMEKKVLQMQKFTGSKLLQHLKNGIS